MFHVSLRMKSLIIVAGFGLTGCGSAPQTPNAPSEHPPATVDEHAGHGHAHPAEGPHHGDLVELGAEEYHAEVVHESNGAVSVYLLDGTAKNAAPIDAAEVTFNVTHDGKPEQFKLPADPEATDPAGTSSRFTLSGSELDKHLDVEGATAKLVVTISGKSYSGQLEHDHDHAHEGDHKH